MQVLKMASVGVCLWYRYQAVDAGSTLGLVILKLPLRYPYLAFRTAVPLAHWLQYVVSDAHQYKKRRAFASCTTHSRPSCKFIPVMALQVMMCHLCVLMASSRSPCMQLALARQPVSISSSAVTHLANLVLRHGAGNVTLVFEDEQTRSGKALLLSVRVFSDDIRANLFL
jgi:hypothetical protein